MFIIEFGDCSYLDLRECSHLLSIYLYKSSIITKDNECVGMNMRTVDQKLEAHNTCERAFNLN